MTKVLKILAITVSVLIVLALIILLILWLILLNGVHHEQTSISHEYLQSVMTDDVVYLSDDFLTANSLELQPLEKGRIDGVIIYDEADVWITYNSNKDRTPDFTQKIKSAERYSYTLKSAEGSDGIPVTVQVECQTGAGNRSIKYHNEYGGYKYRTYPSSYNSQTTEYDIKTSPKSFKSCILSLRIKIENDGSYTDEQIKAREDEIFKSAVDNIIKYQG